MGSSKSTDVKNKIIRSMQVKPQIDAQFEIQHRIDFIAQHLKNANLSGLVLGISGGVDSSLCGRLCQLAVDQLKQTTSKSYQFYAVRLPYLIQADEDAAQAALQFIQPDRTLTVNVQQGVDGLHTAVTQAFAADAPFDAGRVDFVKGNTKARLRMAAQFEIAGLIQGMVVGTDHSAENVMGFYTKYGDGACDIAPLFGLNKRQIRSLAAHLGAPTPVYNKEPTADLEDLQPLKADEKVLGVTYDQIDDFLEGKPVDAVAERRIIDTFQATEHKRQAIPTPP
jgi:NAD+ synthase